MDRKTAIRILKILEAKTKETPKLEFAGPLQLLVATILSAQSTDAQINSITPRLFKRYRTAKDYANSDIRELEALIYSSGFYKSKAKNIRAACSIIDREFGGRVPNSMEALLRLPGVGRKTANIVLLHGFGIVEGIAVDTHVARLSRRLGFSNAKSPEAIERDLMKLIPKGMWSLLNRLLIDHGRNICTAKSPKCWKCPVGRLCPSFSEQD